MVVWFDTEIAATVGLNAAIVLNNIVYWVLKNEANEVHYHDGKYWTYNSFKAFQKLFPFLTERMIKYALAKLKDDGYILVEQFNKDKMNHTNWYTLTDKGWALYPNRKPQPFDADKSAPFDGTSLSHRQDKNAFPTNITKKEHTEVKQDTRARPRAKAAPKAQPSHVSCPFYNPSQDLVAAWAGFEEMRRKIKKPMTQRAADLIAKRLQKLAPDDMEKQAAILDQSVAGCWQNVYPLKPEHVCTEAPRPSGYGEPSANDLYEAAKAMLEGGTPL